MHIFDHINKKVVGMAFGSLVLIVGLSWYLFYGTSAEQGGAVTELVVSPLEKTIGKDMLATLSKMKVTTLDEGIFEDPVFRSLRDFGVEIASQPIGRRNPFGAFAVVRKPVKKTVAGGGGNTSPIVVPFAPAGGGGGGGGNTSPTVPFAPPSPEDIMLFDDFSF